MFMMMMMKVPDFRLQLSDIIKINTVGKKKELSHTNTTCKCN